VILLTKFEQFIDGETAKALGLKTCQLLLSRADKLIKQGRKLLLLENAMGCFGFFLIPWAPVTFGQHRPLAVTFVFSDERSYPPC
jgi:hypothetical protein